MICEGLCGKNEMIVTPADTAAVMGSGTLDVLATPRVAALMEMTAWQSLGDELEAGSTTVGTMLSLRHLAPTPVGRTVRCESKLEKIDGRELTFSLLVYDQSGLIADAQHKRVIVDSARFTAKAGTR